MSSGREGFAKMILARFIFVDHAHTFVAPTIYGTTVLYDTPYCYAAGNMITIDNKQLSTVLERAISFYGVILINSVTYIVT